jgi:hypothetical protein
MTPFLQAVANYVAALSVSTLFVVPRARIDGYRPLSPSSACCFRTPDRVETRPIRNHTTIALRICGTLSPLNSAFGIRHRGDLRPDTEKIYSPRAPIIFCANCVLIASTQLQG